MTTIVSPPRHATSGYDPARYWEKRGRHYECEPRKNEAPNMLEWLQEVQPQSILEIGAGTGWVYDRLAAVELEGRLVMCDFVESLRRQCFHRIGILPDLWDGHVLPYADESYEMVLTYNVLLHVPPADIENFFMEQVRVAARWIFAATLFSHTGVLAAHCFIHDYEALFDQFGLVVVKERTAPADHRRRSAKSEHVQWLLTKVG